MKKDELLDAAVGSVDGHGFLADEGCDPNLGYVVPNYVETKLPKEKRMECRGIVKTINQYGVSQRMKLYLIYLLSLELENRESMMKIVKVITECKDNVEDSKLVVGGSPSTGTVPQKKILLG